MDLMDHLGLPAPNAFDRHAPRCGDPVLVVSDMTVPGAQSTPGHCVARPSRAAGISPPRGRTAWLVCLALTSCLIVLLTPALRAQSASQQSGQPAATFQLPTLIVTAQKEPAEAQALPLSLTTVATPTLQNAGIQIVSEAGAYGPNLQFTEFTARKLSNARFRGIGASPANPSITTFFDGVPQLNANTSSIDLVDVDQIEFVRGPQSALFGRNALGGLINVTSTRPSLDAWSGSVSVPIGNVDARDIRGGVAGPLVAGRLAMAASLQYGRRDGYTVNDLTGNDLDSRSAFAGKGQVLWTPARNWETRVIVNGERDRDGDYALSDLGGLRRNPYHTARDFEGHTHRDIFATTILNRHEGTRLTFSATTGFLSWNTEDLTDLDYSPLPLVTRDNREESFQFTQEVRVASPATAPLRFSDNAALKWQGGVFLFTQSYDQLAVRNFAPGFLLPFLPIPIQQTSPRAALDDIGIGVFGQGTVTLTERIDLTAGLRFDHEQKDATLNVFFTPPIAPAQETIADESFSNVSPQFAAAFHVTPGKTVYASVAKGYKAGGFNAGAPPRAELYDEEHTWNVEGGMKTTWANGRVAANAAVFRIDWDDMQLNLPNLFVPGEFYIANVGGATSSGVELELNARLHPNVDVFGGIGYTRARFTDDSISGGVPVAGNKVPNTPDYTASLGVQVSRPLAQGASLYGRAEATFSGAFEYDDLNTERQEAYSLANFRAGVRGRLVFVEAWIRNAFDTEYIPVAFAYGQLAPSGFIGEMGRPRTYGISAGVGF
jgi:iron complex outermembrane receptor protein